MKALTVRQPHAQLIALGIKHIETRTKPTKYRGPLLIHAGAHKPLNHEHRHVDHDEVPMWIDQVDISRFWKWYEHPDNMYHGGLYCWDGPLGAIVASCKLVDCVPIIGAYDPFPPMAVHGEGRVIRLFSDHSMSLVYYNSLGTRSQGVGDQRPYGDFTPGRYAWLLEDIQPVEKRCPACWGTGARAGIPSHQLTAGDSFSAPPCPICHSKRTCDPIPAKGNQGLWEWTP